MRYNRSRLLGLPRTPPTPAPSGERVSSASPGRRQTLRRPPSGSRGPVPSAPLVGHRGRGGGRPGRGRHHSDGRILESFRSSVGQRCLSTGRHASRSRGPRHLARSSARRRGRLVGPGHVGASRRSDLALSAVARKAVHDGLRGADVSPENVPGVSLQACSAGRTTRTGASSAQ